MRVLATSREPLGTTGELLLPVEPPPDQEALRLLTDRRPLRFFGGTGGSQVLGSTPGTAAQSAEPRSADDPAQLRRICRALDGMPLAIELAAARLSALTPAQVADRLDDRFRLLTRGSRTALPRHRTLRAVVDWSWDLLDDDERRLLRRLSIVVALDQLRPVMACDDPWGRRDGPDGLRTHPAQHRQPPGGVRGVLPRGPARLPYDP